jgi:hypothetical protein
VSEPAHPPTARRRQLLRAVAPPLTAGLISLLHRTARVEMRRREVLRAVHERGGRFVMAFWHSRLLLVRHVHPGGRLAAVISRHGDGELIARTMARFGHAAARGSSTRGGSQALREALRLAAAGWDLAITPDGPRGPARIVKPGVVELSRLTGLPVVPVSVAARPALHLSSWDRFEVALPFARVVHACGEPIECPREAGPDERLELRRRIGRRLDELTDECRGALGLPPWEAVADHAPPEDHEVEDQAADEAVEDGS